VFIQASYPLVIACVYACLCVFACMSVCGWRVACKVVCESYLGFAQGGLCLRDLGAMRRTVCGACCLLALLYRLYCTAAMCVEYCMWCLSSACFTVPPVLYCCDVCGVLCGGGGGDTGGGNLGKIRRTVCAACLHVLLYDHCMFYCTVTTACFTVLRRCILCTTSGTLCFAAV
jgi:hypothetical protein